MSTLDQDARLPLTARRAVSTFGMSVTGLLTANLLPFMVIALQDSLGMDAAQAGAVMTGSWAGAPSSSSRRSRPMPASTRSC